MAGPIRQPIDIPALERYLSAHTEIKAPLTVQQFGYGQSNPTYLLTSPLKQNYVLRKKPPGKLLNPTAHAIEREHRIISALSGTSVPVPAPITLCEDSSVIGSPFYVMGFLHGRIFADPSIPDVTPDNRRKMWVSALETLAVLHGQDIDAVGLGSFGKRSGFYQRQLKTLTTISNAQDKAGAGPIPGFQDLTSYFALTDRQPEDITTIVHGDYKIDNLVFHPTEPRVIGILDWELSTLGHPLSDLCNLLGPYYTAGAGASLAGKAVDDKSFIKGSGWREGLLSMGEAVEVYENAAGRKVQALKWGCAFGLMKNAVISQGITARHAKGQASSARAGEYKELTPKVAGLATRLVEEDKRERGQTVKGRL